MRRVLLFGLAAGLACSFVGVRDVSAESITIGSVYSFRSDRTANPLGLLTSSIVIGANGVTPNPFYQAPGGTADPSQTTVTASQAGTVVELGKLQGQNTQFRDTYIGQIPYDPNLTGQWQVTAANPTAAPVPELTASTIAFGNVAAVPFVSSMALSGTGSDLNLTWVQPDPTRVDRQTIFVYQSNGAGGYQFIFSEELGTTVREFDLSAIGLTEGTPYVVSIDTSDNIGNATAASSASYFSFTPTAQTINAYLPSVSTPGSYEFDVDISTPGEVVFIDPDPAIGYDFVMGTGDPKFASTLLPEVGDNLYDLWLFDSEGTPYDSGFTLTAGVEFDFLSTINPLGIDSFRILGIEESAMLDPENPLAFQAGVSFASAGKFTGTMTALVPSDIPPVPEPATLALLGSGLGGLALRRWRGRSRARRA